MSEPEVVTESLKFSYAVPYILSAVVHDAGDGNWYYVLSTDGGFGPSEGVQLSSVISRMFDSYDRAVIHMNDELLRQTLATDEARSKRRWSGVTRSQG